MRKKKIAILLYVIGILCSSNTFADSVCIDKFMRLQCKSGSVDSINYTGMVYVDGTTVANGFNVWGNVNVMNAHLNKLSIKGATNISKSNVKGDVELTGSLTINDVDLYLYSASRITGDLFGGHITLHSKANIVGTVECTACIFRDDATLIGDITLVDSEFSANTKMNFRKADFSNTKIIDVVVAAPDDDKEQTIYLKQGSTVHDITFEGGKGIVILSGKSEISGYIKGGKVQKS
jgi:cytoskeletal protein CcmA (bactofilin family)